MFLFARTDVITIDSIGMENMIDSATEKYSVTIFGRVFIRFFKRPVSTLFGPHWHDTGRNEGVYGRNKV